MHPHRLVPARVDHLYGDAPVLAGAEGERLGPGERLPRLLVHRPLERSRDPAPRLAGRERMPFGLRGGIGRGEQVVGTNLGPRPKSCAVLILRGNDPPLHVGRLPETVHLPILEGGSRDVHLSYMSYRHIIERRDNERPEHVGLVLARLSTVIAAPTHFGRLNSRQTNKVDLFAWHRDGFAGVVVCLKLLAGETWVNTAFPLGRRRFRDHLEAARLVPLRSANLDAFEDRA